MKMGQTAAVGAPQWSPPGERAEESGDRLLTWGNDHQVKIWRIGDSGPIGSPASFLNSGNVMSVSWSTDGTRVVVGSDARPYATLWDPDHGDSEHGTPHELSEPSDIVWNSVWSPDGKWFAIADNHGQVTIYPPGGGNPRSILSADSPVRGIAWNRRSTQLATGSEDKVLRIWDIDGGKPREYPGYEAEVRAVAWSPDDALVLGTGGNNTAVVWDVASKAKLPELTGHTDIVGFATWDRTGNKVLTTGIDGVARVHMIGWALRRGVACQRVVRNLSKAEWQKYLGNDDWHETCPGKYDP
jgi:WD40 repeat protein